MALLYGGIRETEYTFIFNNTSTTANVYGEYLEYTFPIPIVPISYRIDFPSDSVPVKWRLFARYKEGWYLLDRYENDTIDKQLDTVTPPTQGYIERSIVTEQQFDTFRIVIGLSTGPSVKVKEFSITDQLGKHITFLVPFCTNTNSAYHSGSLNFSKIDSFSLNANLQTDFYAVGHDELTIENGMCI